MSTAGTLAHCRSRPGIGYNWNVAQPSAEVYQFSEDPSIREFIPHVAATHS